MSSPQTVQLAANYAVYMISSYCSTAGAVVFLYDSMITTGEEIRCFWGRKITAAVLLFYLNKYMTILCLVWDLTTGSKMSDKSCSFSVKGGASILYLLFMIPAASTAIRVYALRRSLSLSAITFALALVPLGINFATFRFGLIGENVAPLGCSELDNVPTGVSKIRFSIVSRACLIAADCLAIGATWFTLARPHGIRHVGVRKDSISSILLTDGTVYFLILAVLNSLHLAFTLLSIDVPALQATSVVTDFTTPYVCICNSLLSMCCVLINHMHC
ncbi:hypothetical protein BD311DRAFT_734500 [Dichomitus squalens]|uniref:DUF6533 domain-containing protein n=1 Tax=Dichomitus squalens TaxID=114155 RepID=A0A4Q9M3K9_9APHY|nr:hypothetical protein BD311DRAFT_734500 [Dichomitus squalens]